MRILKILISSLLLQLSAGGICCGSEVEARAALVAVILADGAEQADGVAGLVGTGDPVVGMVLTAWQRGELYLFDAVDGGRVPFVLEDAESEAPTRAIGVLDGEFLRGEAGEVLTFVGGDLKALDTTSKLRRAMRTTMDLLALASKRADVRAAAALKLGLMQKAVYIEPLQKALAKETDEEARRKFEEGIAVSMLLMGEGQEVLAAVETLGGLRSMAGLDALKALQAEQQRLEEGDEGLQEALAASITEIESYLSVVDFFGTCFRGLSLGSVLLIVALGLAITFGLMGVINMAHGEMIAIGGYATYMVETWMVGAFGPSALEWYFVLAIPVGFVTAAAAGVVLERGVIQFLYKRPLESLLATWGVSLILQQVFRLVFGAANVQVNSPRWLMGSFDVSDVTLGYNRIFVIVFAVLIVVGTWLLMAKTPLGLCVRSVMQNRDMAACIGVRTARVRTVTFAFGSGLAGMAGAFLSQIGNVGPSMGQNYIVDSFMVVVAGGAGSIAGTVLSAFGIGVTDQVLQPSLGPVMGKVCVLFAIILFLQWRPGGLFASKSRALDG